MLMQVSGSWEARMLQLRKLLSASVCTCTVALPCPKEILQTELPASSILAASALHLFRALPWMPTPDSSPVPATSLPVMPFIINHTTTQGCKGAVVWHVGTWGPEIVLKFIFSKPSEYISKKKKKLIHCDLYVFRPTLLYFLVGKHLGCLLWPLFTVLKHPCFRPALSSASSLPYLILTCLFEIGHMLILTHR